MIRRLNLTQRVLTLIEGKDCVRFIQGICTNNVEKFYTSEQLAMHALFLDPKGRILFDSLVMKDFLNKGLILDTHKGFKQVLEETLKKYSFRRAVEISDMNSKFQVSSVFSNDSSLNLSKHVTGSVLAFEDPRNPSLGWRRLDYKENISEVNEDEEKEFKVWRIFHGVPEGPAIQNQIPHHLNFQYLNSISLNKGCYVGQELIARTSTQGVVRTGIFSFVVGKNFMGWENIDWKLKDLTSAKVFNRNGEQVGVVLESVGNVGLVKGKYADFEEECFLEGGEKINIVKPSYFRVD